MKLYTKRGDDGGTDLFGGARIGKDSLRIAAVGEVDELNAAIGLAAAASRHVEIGDVLRVLQNRLFELGADLATPRRGGNDAGKPPAIPRIGQDQIAEAEGFIDVACAPVPPLRSFVLPGGSELAARLHVARAVARRAERACVALARTEDVGPAVVIYLNRLSDLMFALARRANQMEGVGDVPWVTR